MRVHATHEVGREAALSPATGPIFPKLTATATLRRRERVASSETAREQTRARQTRTAPRRSGS